MALNLEGLKNFKDVDTIMEKKGISIEHLETVNLLQFEKHPFKIKEDERFNDLLESIKEQGVIMPLVVRIHPTQKGRYEILAGHHRHLAALKLNLTVVPCIIKHIDDDMASLIVVESNKQRGFSDMLPSEIAKTLKLEYDALKHQGKRTDLMNELGDILNEKNISNSLLEQSENEENLQKKEDSNTDDNKVYSTSRPLVGKLNKVENKNKMSERNIQRYIRLIYLSDDLINLVDGKEIGIRPGVDLSFLNDEEQDIVYDLLQNGCKVDMKKSEILKNYSANGKLNKDSAMLVLSGAKLSKKEKKLSSVKVSYKKISEYVDTTLSSNELEEYIINAVKFYKNRLDESGIGE